MKIDLMAQEDDGLGGFGGNSGGGYGQQDNGGGGQQQTAEADRGTGGGTQQQAPQQPAFDPRAFTQSISDGVVQGLKQAQPAPQMTREDFERESKYYRIPTETAKALFGDEDPNVLAAKTKILQQLIDNSNLHSIQVARMLHDNATQTLRNEFAPALTYAQTQQLAQQQQQFMGDFNQKYPSLKEHAQMTNMVINNLKAMNFQPQSRDHAMQTIATYTEQAIRSLNPNFSLQQSNGNSNGSGNMPGFPGVTNGSGGGTGGGGGGNAKKKTYLDEIWPNN